MEAPGGPGAPATWGPGRKQGFGTARGNRSLVWFTIARGNLSEVFYPRVDRPFLHDLRFIVAARGSAPIDDAREATHDVRWVEPGVPAFTVQSTHSEYSLTTEYLSDPDRNAILISGQFLPEQPDISLYVLLTPHLAPNSDGNLAQLLDREPVAIAARGEGAWVVAVGPFRRASAGYKDSSDIYVALHDNDGDLGTAYDSAGPGNVAVGAELGLRSGAFQVVLGFGPSLSDAEEVAMAARDRGHGDAKHAFIQGWRAADDLPAQMARVSGDGGAFARASLATLRSLEDKSRPGAFIAAPAAPWGEKQSDGNHVYHLVWPRDLFQIATALLAAGDREAAERALGFLRRTQLPDGSWHQNTDADGKPHWDTTELDEVAQPILLAWALRNAGGEEEELWESLVKQAATYLVRNGPRANLDRWEDRGGLSPSTLADCVAALLIAAELAADAGEYVAADYMRSVADYWADRVEAWCFMPARRCYARLGSDPDAGADPAGAAGVDFLELIRRGVRSPSDPRILSSLQQVDALLKATTPAGTAWRRYQGDRYGESDSGQPWPNEESKGRAWPLLTGERAHHQLALRQPAAEAVRNLEAFAGPELVLSEQVWDSDPVPGADLLPGRPTGSASPLGWAHAEYLRLLAAIGTGFSVDVVAPARRRYLDNPPADVAFVWSHAHPIRTFVAGRRVRIQLPRPAVVRWTPDGWANQAEVPTVDTTLGLWVAELPTQIMRPGAVVEWTIHYEGQWEGRNYELACREDLPD